MVPQSYYDMLALNDTASLDDVKKAYRLVAKRNHPDLFPEDERPRCLNRMVAVNEAYRAIVKDITSVARGSAVHGNDEGLKPEMNRHSPGNPQRRETSSRNASPESRKTPAAPAFDPFAPALPRDPGYVYYKRGYVLYSQGRKALLQRYNGRRLDFTNLNTDVLKLAVSSLAYFHKSYEHFRQVVERYPDSIWARDAEIKMYFLKRYDAIYRRICDNMRRQLKSETD